MKKFNAIALFAFCSICFFVQVLINVSASENNVGKTSNSTEVIGYRQLPDTFKKLMQNTPLHLLMKINGVPFKRVLAKLSQGVLHIYIDEVNKLNLSKSASQILKKSLMEGLSLNGHQRNYSVIRRYQMNFETMQLNIELQKQFTATKNIKQKQIYLPGSSISHLASVFSYDLNSSGYTGRRGSNTDVYNAYLNNTLGFKNNSVRTGVNLFRTDKKSTSQLDHLFVQHDFKKSATRLGYFQTNTSNLTTALPYTFLGSTLLFSLQSSSNRLLNKRSQSLTPVNVFLGASSSVRVYKNNQLIYSRFLPVGAHTLDTSDFPSGNYSIRIDIYQNGVKVNSYRRNVNKPSFGLNNILSTPGHFQYNFWTGLVDPKSAYDFNESIVGGSMNILLGRNNAVQFGSYVEAGRDNLVVTQLSDFFYTSAGTLNATFGMDNDGGYARNIGYDYNISPDFGVGASYVSVHSKSTISPFSSTRSFGVDTNFSMSRLGSASASYNHDLDDNTNQLTLSYSKELYRFNGLSVVLQVNQSQYDSSLHNEGHRLDRSIMVDFDYTMGNGDLVEVEPSYVDQSANRSSSHSSNLNLTWQPHQTDTSWLSEVSSSWNHNNSSDTFTFTGAANTKALTGSAGVSKSFSSAKGGQSNSGVGYNAEISGAVALAGNNRDVHGAFSSDDNARSGVIVYAGIPKGGKLNAMINDDEVTLHRGSNFIPETPYATYNLYLVQNDNTAMLLNFDPLDEDFTLYPGNIKYMDVQAWNEQMIVGQVIYKGKPLPGVEIQSQIASGSTDQQGYFMLDDKAGNKLLQVSLKGVKMCEINLSGNHSDKPSVWLGKLQCSAEKRHSIGKALASEERSVKG